MPPRTHPDSGLLRGMPDSVSRSLWRSAAWTGAVAAATGAVLSAMVAIVCWLPDAGTLGHPLSAVRAGILAFLAAHHGGVTVDGVPFSFAPLLGTFVVALLAWRAGAMLAEIARQTRVRRPAVLFRAGLLQAGCYAIACAVLTPLGSLGTSSARPSRVGVAAFVLFAAVATASLVRSSRGLRRGLPARLMPATRVATAALAVYVGGGALLVAGSLVVHAGRVTELSRMVGGGVSGLPIAVLGVLCAPNAAVAGAAYLAGPGFVVGAGTTVNAFSASHGLLPAFPLLGALPSGHGANPVVLAWMAITVLGAGVVASRLVGSDDVLRGVAAAAALAGSAMALLAWLGGGGAGTDRLATIGASPWQVGVVVAGEIAVIALVTIGLRRLWRRITSAAQAGWGRADGEDQGEADTDDAAGAGLATVTTSEDG